MCKFNIQRPRGPFPHICDVNTAARCSRLTMRDSQDTDRSTVLLPFTRFILRNRRWTSSSMYALILKMKQEQRDVTDRWFIDEAPPSSIPVVRERQQAVQTLDVADWTCLLIVNERVAPGVFFTFTDPLSQLLDLLLHSKHKQLSVPHCKHVSQPITMAFPHTTCQNPHKHHKWTGSSGTQYQWNIGL